MRTSSGKASKGEWIRAGKRSDELWPLESRDVKSTSFLLIFTQTTNTKIESVLLQAMKKRSSRSKKAKEKKRRRRRRRDSRIIWILESRCQFRIMFVERFFLIVHDEIVETIELALVAVKSQPTVRHLKDFDVLHPIPAE